MVRVGGLEYSCNPLETMGRRITDMRLNGKPLEASRQYKVEAVFDGFAAPVDNQPVVNLAIGGQSIPVKFGIGGDGGLGILEAGYPKSTQMVCDATSVPDPIESTTTANSGLSFTGGSYTYVWKTEKSWAGTARLLTVTLSDGTKHLARFTFTK